MNYAAIDHLARRYHENSEDVAQHAKLMILERVRARGPLPENASAWYWVQNAAVRLGLQAHTRGTKQGDALSATHERKWAGEDTDREPWDGCAPSAFPAQDVVLEAKRFAERMPEGIPLVIAGEIEAGDLAAYRGTTRQNEHERARVCLRRAQREATL